MSKSKRFTYANVAATLALVFSMSGGALAASKYLITSTKQISPKVLKSLKGKNGQPGAAGAAGATGKEGPPGKDGATGKEGPAGKEATNALNAQSLGGIPAASYTRSDCNSLTGQVKGFALVPAESKFSSTFVKVNDAYNCSGQEVQAKRTGEGIYVVKFLGSPVTIPVGNLVDIASFFDNAFVSFKDLGPGEFEVEVYNAVIKGDEDRPFSVVTP
jgi:Collagen triple helix repeat (20 copies)